jgi:hypothetical protein
MERRRSHYSVRLPSLPGRRRLEIERELATHLEETRRELQLAGLSTEDAERESLARLGDLTEIADGFEKVYRPRRSTRLVLAFTVAGGLVAGAYSSGALASSASVHHGHALHARVQSSSTVSRTNRR